MIQKCIKHQRQEKVYSCSAACLSMLVGIAEKEARKELNTTCTGTYFYKFKDFFNKNAIKFSAVDIFANFELEYRNFLRQSIFNPILLSGKFVSRYHVKGRDRISYHTILLADGLVYDPSESESVPIDCYFHTFNKNLIINAAIIVSEERPDWKVNWEKFCA